MRRNDGGIDGLCHCPVPTLPGNVTIEEVIGEVAVIAALRNRAQAQHRVLIDPRHLNIAQST